MNYVFGPIPSRRLGQSLGIDTIPLKTCNWNCVYCQLGRSVPLTNERCEYFPRADILTEVEQSLAASPPGAIDWVTFVGSGEPTLHSGIGWLIRQVKALTSLPVAVITNGALLYLPKVREELTPANAVLPTLDAGNPRLYRKINRPHPKITFERQVDGLSAFRREYQGQLWVEIMLVRGLNDTEEALKEIASVLQRIQPDQVHITLPTRPPAEAWVQLSDEAGLKRAVAILSAVAPTVAPPPPALVLSLAGSLGETLLGIITRHPLPEDELARAAPGCPPEILGEILHALLVSGQAQVVERYGKRFWSAAGAKFPHEDGRGGSN